MEYNTEDIVSEIKNLVADIEKAQQDMDMYSKIMKDMFLMGSTTN